MNHLNSEELIKEFSKGNLKAFEILIKKEEIFIKKLLFIFLKGEVSEIDDVMQEVLLALYCGLHKFNFKSSFKTYLYKIIKNKAVDFLRNKKRSKNLIDKIKKFYENNFEQSEEELLVSKENNDSVMKNLFRLKEEERTLIFLKDIEGVSLADISSLLDLKLSNVKTKLKRARLKLYKILKRYSNE